MSRQNPFRAADSHVQNEAYLARLGEAMARLEMGKSKSIREPTDAPQSQVSGPLPEDRDGKLRLLKGKLRRRSGGGESSDSGRVRDQVEGGVGGSGPGCGDSSGPGLSSGLSANLGSGSTVAATGERSHRAVLGSSLALETKTGTGRKRGTDSDTNKRRTSGGSADPGSSSSHKNYSQPSSQSGRNTWVQESRTQKRLGGKSLSASASAAASGFALGEPPDQRSERTSPDDGPSTSGASGDSGVRSHRRSSLECQRWGKGPVDEAGKVTKLSEQPILCMSVLDTEAVVGSSDHALYTVDLETGRKKRTLYGKTAGHTEWVTCVAYLPDGRILSGGMDNRLLLWASTGATHCDLLGHTASISAVRTSSDGSLAVSSSYDKTLRIWALPRGDARVAGREKASGFGGTATCLIGHVAPVLDFAWEGGRVVSGARDGCVILWDIQKAAASRRLARAHVGHVTALARWSDTIDSPQNEGRSNLFLTGGQDGFLRAWDGRSDRAVAEAPVHVAANGKGAVSSIRAAADVIVTAGADGMVRVLDPRASFCVRNSFSGPKNFIYSLHVAGRTAFSGGGDGSVLVHDIVDGRTLYGLGANNNGAVRCIETTNSKLVCAGDDGTLISYEQDSAPG